MNKIFNHKNFKILFYFIIQCVFFFSFYLSWQYGKIKNNIFLIDLAINFLNLFGEYYGLIFNNLLDKKIIGLQIIEPITIGYYELAMIKTHWIRLIQRRWREIRKKRLNAKKNIFNLRHREIYGKYPDNCNIPFKLNIN